MSCFVMRSFSRLIGLHRVYCRVYWFALRRLLRKISLHRSQLDGCGIWMEGPDKMIGHERIRVHVPPNLVRARFSWTSVSQYAPPTIVAMRVGELRDVGSGARTGRRCRSGRGGGGGHAVGGPAADQLRILFPHLCPQVLPFHAHSPQHRWVSLLLT